MRFPLLSYKQEERTCINYYLKKAFKALQHIFKKAIRKQNEKAMSDKINVGIVGLGRISTLHLEAYNKKNKLDAELVAV
ncbi:MAG: hypothetical protein KAJ72_00690 [Candidatus Heimdallarchaeota archaeon]|nr:hypothetical protein [Candidatus Heimdallarchaeota archaeon]MCK5409871.1 hypothetical protein [Candidatus Heimdallarchaeota archaeon]